MTGLRDDLIASLEAEIETLRERVRQLEILCGAGFVSPPHLGLTFAEARIFGLLIKLPLLRRDAALSEIYGLRPDGEIAEVKIVDVFVCNLRKKLKPFGVAVSTQWGQGYYLTPADKEAAIRQLDPWRAAA